MIPTGERVCVLSRRRFDRGLTAVNRGLAVSDFAALKLCAVFVHEFDRVLVDGAAVCGGISSVSGDFRDFGIPTGERVCVLSRRRFDRGLAGINRGLAVSDFADLKLCAVFVHEYDRVLVDGAAELRGIRRVAGDFRDFGIPAGEFVGVLSVGFLGRGRAVVSRGLAVSDFSVLKHRAIVIHELDRVYVGSFGEQRRVRSRTGNGRDLRIPSGKRVVMLNIAGLDGGISGILRQLAVCDESGLKNFAVIVHKPYRILVDRCAVRGSIRRDARNVYNIRRPARKSICEFGCCFLNRFFMCRTLAVFHHCLIDKRSVIIEPCDRIRSPCFLELRHIRSRGSYRNNARSPTDKLIFKFIG